MKNFTKTRWIDCLRAQNWDRIAMTENINDQTEEISKRINLAMDECAPYKKFKTRQNFKPGLTEAAKNIMRERDITRKSILSAPISEKPGLTAKYRNLRNKAVSQMRMDALEQNSRIIHEAKNESETWKVVNEIIRPRSTAKITISTPMGDVSEETSSSMM